MGITLAVLLGVAGCAGENSQRVSVVDSAAASASSDTDEVDSENARRFAPVDAQPAPTVTAVPPPMYPAPQGLPPVPPPPSFGGVNECGVVFPNPALMVWGIDDANPDGGLWIHEAPSDESARLRLLPRDALTQFMTAGCQLGPDGTPWYEFGSETGQIGYADSTFLRFSQLACLVDMAEVRNLEGVITAIWSGPIEGHAYNDGSSVAAFIPNDQIGFGQPYRLVSTESVIFVKSFERAPCDLSDRQPELEASRAARADGPGYRGDCVTGPVSDFGPTLFIDIDGLEPIDAVMLTATQPVGDELFATLTVLVGAEDDNGCVWRDVANVYSGPLEREDGQQNQHVWSCFENGVVGFVQYVFDADPVRGASVTSFNWIDGEMQIESSGRVTETLDTTSTCEISPKPRSG